MNYCKKEEEQMYKIISKYGKDGMGKITLAEYKYVDTLTGDTSAELIDGEIVWYKELSDFERMLFNQIRYDIMEDDYLHHYDIKPRFKEPAQTDLDEWLKSWEGNYDFQVP
jgi:hypothetical protein